MSDDRDYPKGPAGSFDGDIDTAIDQLIARHAPVHDVDPRHRRRVATVARRTLASPPRRLMARTWLARRYRAVEPALVVSISAVYLGWCASVVWGYFS